MVTSVVSALVHMSNSSTTPTSIQVCWGVTWPWNKRHWARVSTLL